MCVCVRACARACVISYNALLQSSFSPVWVSFSFASGKETITVDLFAMLALLETCDKASDT